MHQAAEPLPARMDGVLQNLYRSGRANVWHARRAHQATVASNAAATLEDQADNRKKTNSAGDQTKESLEQHLRGTTIRVGAEPRVGHRQGTAEYLLGCTW